MVLSVSRLAAARMPLKNCLFQQQASSPWRATAGMARQFCSKGGDKTPTDPALERLFKHNREWVDKVNKEDPNFFPKLGSGQSPEFLYIGCSDSRVEISSLIGLEMGELFVHRNIANMVVSSDLNLLAVMTYAVEHLKVKHILVTGHYDCGGVRAGMGNKDIGPVLDAWVQNIRDVYRLHQDELDAIVDDEARHRRLVELNVAEQCLNVYKTAVVQKRRYETHADPEAPFAYPRVHGLVFDPATGLVSKVPSDYRRTVKVLRGMYDLFDEKDFKAPKGFLLKKK
ncbi:anhydrase 2 [Seminavis robusta]|uniref:Carbonic anhydrase n=1 Tax=Seminavis robusta TaxID=568900 RepID=A0A9N8DZY5_9STRA|nr:anhydrase 2 [Seminavis robusta]|eukprot:Sro411_g137710.1 anhydrase 2 (284) ;mRNA; r:45421-46272